MNVSISEETIDAIIRMRKKGKQYYAIYENLCNKCTILEIRKVSDFIDRPKERDYSKMNLEEYRCLEKLISVSCSDMRSIAKVMGRPALELKKNDEFITNEREIRYFIYRLYFAGYTEEQMMEDYGLTEDVVSKALCKSYASDVDYFVDRHINIYKLNRFRDHELKVGDKFIVSVTDWSGETTYNHTKKTRCTVLKKFPYICQTDKGAFSYLDLYLAERVK